MSKVILYANYIQSMSATIPKSSITQQPKLFISLQQRQQHSIKLAIISLRRIYLNIIVRNRNLHILHTSSSSFLRSFSMEYHLWLPVLVSSNFNILEWCSSTGRLDSETLEDGLFCTPCAGKTCLRRRRLPAVIKFCLCEVSVQEFFVLNVDGVDCLNINTNI